eukprot:scaffold405737_cov29-Prasinocladus_malaysianus.AAC.1
MLFAGPASSSTLSASAFSDPQTHAATEHGAISRSDHSSINEEGPQRSTEARRVASEGWKEELPTLDRHSESAGLVNEASGASFGSEREEAGKGAESDRGKFGSRVMNFFVPEVWPNTHSLVLT